MSNNTENNIDFTKQSKYTDVLQQLSTYRNSLKKTDLKAYNKFKKLPLNNEVDLLESLIKLHSSIQDAQHNKKSNIDAE